MLVASLRLHDARKQRTNRNFLFLLLQLASQERQRKRVSSPSFLPSFLVLVAGLAWKGRGGGGRPFITAPAAWRERERENATVSRQERVLLFFYIAYTSRSCCRNLHRPTLSSVFLSCVWPSSPFTYACSMHPQPLSPSLRLIWHSPAPPPPRPRPHSLSTSALGEAQVTSFYFVKGGRDEMGERDRPPLSSPPFRRER